MVIGARALAWSVLAGSIAIGGLASEPGARSGQTSGPYTILTADFHVHSFPGDGGLLPWDLAVEARRRGIDVIALTNHNAMMSWRLMQHLSPDPAGVIVLPGFELTSAGYHMAAVGLETIVTWRQLPAAAAAEVRAHGGVAIGAHPLAHRRSKWDDAAIDALDGIEAASAKDMVDDLAAFTRRAMARDPSLAPIGASDFHYFAPLGFCRTFVFVTERSAAGVLDAVRRGRTVACDPRGETYGSAELARVVSAECRRTAGAPPLERHRAETFATAGAWLGLVALIVVGSDRRTEGTGGNGLQNGGTEGTEGNGD
jgi:hypothetical protein